eukprot:365257-Chlamydomonas_euryale.AAC.10
MLYRGSNNRNSRGEVACKLSCYTEAAPARRDSAAGPVLSWACPPYLTNDLPPLRPASHTCA